MAISRARRVKIAPRLASLAAFLRLIVDHFECPDMAINPGHESIFGARDNYNIRPLAQA